MPGIGVDARDALLARVGVTVGVPRLLRNATTFRSRPRVPRLAHGRRSLRCILSQARYGYLDASTLLEPLNRAMLSWTHYFYPRSIIPGYKAIDMHGTKRLGSHTTNAPNRSPTNTARNGH